MQSPVSAFGVALALCCSLFFVVSSAVGQQGGTVGFDPTLRSLQNDRIREDASREPQYDIVELPEKKLLRYYPELKGLVPAQSQEELPKLLEKIGANENLLIAVPSITADENVTQEKLDKHGWPTGLPVFTGHYKYLVRAHLTGEGTRFTEGRTDQQFQPVDPKVPSGYSLIQGFALMPMHFHPLHQQAGHFRYLGRQALNNREYYIIAFAQQPEKAELLGSVIVNGKDITVAYQGLAWIDPDSFQIARMRTDLFKARPEVGAETTETLFSEVRLPVVNKSFWLPTSAVITRRKKDDALRENHEFSDYKIFVK